MTKQQKMWLEVAEAFGTPFEERTKLQIEITKHGLCWAYWVATSSNHKEIMDNSADPNGENSFYSLSIGFISDDCCYWCRTRAGSYFRPVYDTWRSQFALFMVAMNE